MLFSHDTTRALACAVDLVNSAPSDTSPDGLVDLPALAGFVERHDVSEVGRLTDADLEAVRRLRDAVRAVFQAPDERTAAPRINALVAEAAVTPRLTDHDGYDWHVHYFSPGARLADHLSVDCGMALAQVLAAGELRPAPALRGPGLRPGARRPVPEPVQALLRRPDLRQPAARGGLPRAPAHRRPLTSPPLPPFRPRCHFLPGFRGVSRTSDSSPIPPDLRGGLYPRYCGVRGRLPPPAPASPSSPSSRFRRRARFRCQSAVSRSDHT